MLLLPVVSAKQVFSTQYKTPSCKSAPNVMYVFDLKSPDAITPDPTVNETWPIFYQQVVPDYRIGVCGAAAISISRSCCYSSLNLTATDNYQSGSHSFVEQSYMSMIPSSANGQQYCWINATRPDALNNYVSMMIQADNSCIEGVFKCNPNGQLSIYPDDACNGIPEIVTLNGNPMKFTSPVAGSLSGSIIKPLNPQTRYEYNAYVPAVLLVPDLKANSIDRIQIVLASVCILGSLLTALYFIRRYLQNGDMYILVVAVVNVLQFVYVILRIIYQFETFPDRKVLMIFAEILALAFVISTLALALTSCLFILQFAKKQTFVLKFGLYGLIIALHIAFVGGFYFDFYRLSNISPFNAIINDWEKLGFAWNIVYMCTTIIPPYFVLYQLIRIIEAPTTIEGLQILHQKIGYFLPFMALDAILVVTYFVVEALQQLTLVFPDDHVWLAMDTVRIFLLVVHSTILSLFFERIGFYSWSQNLLPRRNRDRLTLSFSEEEAALYQNYSPQKTALSEQDILEDVEIPKSVVTYPAISVRTSSMRISAIQIKEI